MSDDEKFHVYMYQKKRNWNKISKLHQMRDLQKSFYNTFAKVLDESVQN